MPKIICEGVQNKGFGADAVVTGMQIGRKKMPRYVDADDEIRKWCGHMESHFCNNVMITKNSTGSPNVIYCSSQNIGERKDN